MITASGTPQPCPASSEPIAIAWSGGKDSMLALAAITADGQRPSALVSTVVSEYERVSIHGVRRELLRDQAAALDLELVEVEIPPDCSLELYEARFLRAFAKPPLDQVAEVVFGDLFLRDVRTYRERLLARAKRRGRFPLWGSDTTKLSRSFIDDGFSAIVVCVDTTLLDHSFAGSRYDHDFLDRLPERVDPCGENGEFHSFVDQGPSFERPLFCERGTVLKRGQFAYFELLPSSDQDQV